MHFLPALGESYRYKYSSCEEVAFFAFILVLKICPQNRKICSVSEVVTVIQLL